MTKKLMFLTAAAVLSAWLCAPATRAMEIVPASLSYTATNGAGNPATQTFAVTNEELTAINFSNTVSYSPGSGTNTWFTPSAITGHLEASGSLTLTGSVNIAGLNEGLHYATNTFTSSEAANSPQTLVVTLRVLNPARMAVTPTNILKIVTEGQAAGADVFQVANTGAALSVLTYGMTATSAPTAWLSVNPTNGNALAGTSNQVNIIYGTNTTALTPGWYTGRVDVAAQGEGIGTQTVEVVLQVNNLPGVAWNAASKVWTNLLMHGSDLAATTVEVWNASGAPAAPLNFTVSVLNDPFGWVSVSPASGTSTGDHQLVTVSYTTAGLGEGIYTAQLKLAGADGQSITNGPLYVGLQLTIHGMPVLKTDVTSLSQTILEDYTGTSSFQIQNDGRDPRGGMRYTVDRDVSWVAVSPSTGVVTNTVNSVYVVWGPMSVGVHNGNLTVDAFNAQTGARAGGAPQLMPLTLTVTPRTPLNFELPTVLGKLYIGQMVEVNVGLWQNQSRLTFAYQWERASSAAGAGREVLSGEVGAQHMITTADRGKYLRIAVTATDSAPFPKSSTAYSAWVKVQALQADFNGDGITDLWFYDGLRGIWHANFGTMDSAKGAFPGGPGMLAVPGDYDGNGYEDLGVYEWARGIWHICYLPSGAYAYGSLFGGTAEEAAATPVPADFDGDGATDVCLYYQGYWVIRYSSLGSIVVVEPFAEASGAPMTGDWDGDGTTKMGVYDDGLWTLRLGNGSIVVEEFGGGGNSVLPVPGDYDADNVTDLGVYDTVANQWRWRNSRSGIEQSISFGIGGTAASPGYYDHDRSNDWAQVYVSADNDIIVWEVKRTAEPTNYPYLYHGQSFQQSIERWRVSW